MFTMKFCPQCAQPLGRREVSGHERSVCLNAECGFIHWDNPVPVVAAIVEHADHVCLVRNVGWPRTWYGLVTGFLESGEMPAAAVLREVAEEIGLQGQLIAYLGMYEFYRRNQLLITYHVAVESYDVTIDTVEIADYKWVPVERVRPWSAGTGVALKEWLSARGIEREFLDIDKANV